MSLKDDILNTIDDPQKHLLTQVSKLVHLPKNVVKD